MFTGIIQDVGRVVAMVSDQAGGATLTVATKLDTAAWALGDSIAVNGCCLTVTTLDPRGRFAARLSRETLAVTNLGALSADDVVNLEPALRAGEPLGGHFVSGHVDGTVTVTSVQECGEFREVTCRIARDLAPYVVVKGSIALDGVSLTVNRVGDDNFTICLIPHTLQHTNLSRLRPGTRLNVETDMMARFVARQLDYLRAEATATEGADDAGKL